MEFFLIKRFLDLDINLAGHAFIALHDRTNAFSNLNGFDPWTRHVQQSVGNCDTPRAWHLFLAQ